MEIQQNQVGCAVAIDGVIGSNIYNVYFCFFYEISYENS